MTLEFWEVEANDKKVIDYCKKNDTDYLLIIQPRVGAVESALLITQASIFGSNTSGILEIGVYTIFYDCITGKQIDFDRASVKEEIEIEEWVTIDASDSELKVMDKKDYLVTKFIGTAIDSLKTVQVLDIK